MVLYCSTCKTFHSTSAPCKRRRSSGGTLTGFPRALVQGLGAGWLVAALGSVAFGPNPAVAVAIMVTITAARIIFHFATRSAPATKAPPTPDAAPAAVIAVGPAEVVEEPSTVGATLSSFVVAGVLLALLADLIVFGRLIGETPSEHEADLLTWVVFGASSAWAIAVLVWKRRAGLGAGLSAAGSALLVATACAGWHVGGEARDALVIEARRWAGRSVSVHYDAIDFLTRYPDSPRRGRVFEALVPTIAARIDDVESHSFRTVPDWNLELLALDAHPVELPREASKWDRALCDALAKASREEVRAVVDAVKDSREAGPLLSCLAREAGDAALALEAVRRPERLVELRSSGPRAETRKKVASSERARRGPLATAIARLATEGPDRRIDVVVELQAPPETVADTASLAAFKLRGTTGLLFRAGATGSVPTLRLQGRETLETLELVGAEASPGPIPMPGAAACPANPQACVEKAIAAALGLD